MNKPFLREHLGDLAQLAGVRPAGLLDGPEDGTRVHEFTTGGGLSFQVLADRGMSLGALTFRGMQLAWLSPAGMVHPAFGGERGLDFLKSFPGGFLTTCGLGNVGVPCTDEGREFGQHGRASTLPARQVAWGTDWLNEEACRLWLRGELREEQLFGPALRLTRTISAKLGDSAFRIEDLVENTGFEPMPLMLLQHLNLGWPLLSETARLHLPAGTRTTPRDEAAAAGVAESATFGPPQPGWREQVFYHDCPADAQGWVTLRLENPECGWDGAGTVLELRFPKAEYPHLVQWKQTGQGAYVLGLEPANCLVGGRAAARAAGTLELLPPGATRRFTLEIALRTLREAGRR
ncbi:MAG: aldose 1-epimerase family protein [Lentisphaeria bacterium]|jgi:hypothetical protein